MSDGPTRMPAVGELVRAVIEGDGLSSRVDPGTAERLPARYRVVVTGEVTGWEAGERESYVTLAGWGRVPASAVRRRRWWQR